MAGLLRWLAFLVLIASILLQHPLLFMLAALLLLIVGVTALWGRYALSGVSYTRRLGTPRLFAGEETDLWIEIENLKPLPLPWLKASDEFPEEVELVNLTLQYSHRETWRILANVISLRFYERVRKHYRLRAKRRGVLEFGPAELSSGDMFGLQVRSGIVSHIDSLIVYPRVVPVTGLKLETAHPFGDAKTRRRIADDPLRILGVRPYVAGDNPRLIHWKATARRGDLQTKLFEPGASGVYVLFLDVQTVAFPQGYMGLVSEYLEFAITAAASIANELIERRHAVGLYANATQQSQFDLVRLPASRRPAQWMEILETLARLKSCPAFPLVRYLRTEATALPFGATIIVISAMAGEDVVAALLDLQSAGHPVALFSIGDKAPANIPEELPSTWLGGGAAFAHLSEIALG